MSVVYVHGERGSASRMTIILRGREWAGRHAYIYTSTYMYI